MLFVFSHPQEDLSAFWASDTACAFNIKKQKERLVNITNFSSSMLAKVSNVR
jgi:hypothetical protein